MATRVETHLICDLDDLEGKATVMLHFEGSDYEVDLCEDHLDAYNEAMTPFIGSARRIARRAPATKVRSSATYTPPRADLASVREWARSNGFTINDRGRIPGEVIRAYDERAAAPPSKKRSGRRATAAAK
jgi:hypothetical protein